MMIALTNETFGDTFLGTIEQWDDSFFYCSHLPWEVAKQQMMDFAASLKVTLSIGAGPK